MVLIFDHLSATLISGAVILALASMHLRVTEATVERTLTYQGKQYTLTFGEVMENDLSKVGVGVSSGNGFVANEKTRTVNGQTVTEELVFQARLFDTDPTVYTVKYALEERETVTFAGEGPGGSDLTVPLFEVVRYVDYGSGYVKEGGSSPIVRHFRIRALTNEGQMTTYTNSNVRQLDIRMTTAPPGWHERPQFERKLYWGTRLRPGALNPL